MSIYKNGQKVLGNYTGIADEHIKEVAYTDRNMKTYTEISQIGLSYPCTTGNVFNALSDNSMINLPVRSLANSITDAPEAYGVMTIIKYNKEYFNIIFKRSSDNSVASNNIYIGQLKGLDGSGITWKRLCGTSAKDVEAKEITTFIDSCVNGKVVYSVKNGVCYVTLLDLYSTTAKTDIRVCGLPSAINNPHVPLLGVSREAGLLGLGFLGNDGVFIMHSFVENIGAYTSFSYPISES